MYSTDNGAEAFTWPDGGTTPFRGEKNTNWEGGYRVPTAMRWPGVIKPGTVFNDIFAHEDMLPTIMAAAGEPNVKGELLKGKSVGGKSFKVHLDGYNITDALAGKTPSPRNEFFYWNDDGSLVALRYNQWKIVFAEQRAHGIAVWQDPFVPLRLPKIFNLRSDPFEGADHQTMGYDKWRMDRLFLLVPAQQYIAGFLATFKEFPPSQKVGSFSLDQVTGESDPRCRRQVAPEGDELPSRGCPFGFFIESARFFKRRHWISSSARRSSDGAIVRPSAFAVLRLITSSNLLGCSMGRSPGLAPLRIRST